MSISRDAFLNALRVVNELALEHVNEMDLEAVFAAAGIEVEST